MRGIDMDAEGRISEVLQRLKSGETREQIAPALGLKNRDSLDQYFRRRGYRWDDLRLTYTLRGSAGVNQKAQRIIIEFRSVTADARQVAKIMGFTDHKEMAQYMRDQGFEWSDERRNYVLARAERVLKPTEPTGETNSEPTVDWPQFLSSFIPLLQFLNENRGRLYTLLDSTPPRTLTIPRYAVGGGHTTKSVQLSSVISDLVRDFSEEKGIPQREIFEVALIQFFYRYGYGKQIEKYLVTD